MVLNCLKSNPLSNVYLRVDIGFFLFCASISRLLSRYFQAAKSFIINSEILLTQLELSETKIKFNSYLQQTPSATMLLQTEGNSQPKPLVAGLVKMNDKYYLELEKYENDYLENTQQLVELSIALAKENEAQRDRIAVLEARLRAYGEE